MDKLIVMKPKDVSEMLCCSYGQLMRMVRSNKIPHYRIGSRVLFDKEKLITWVDNGGTTHEKVS